MLFCLKQKKKKHAFNYDIAEWDRLVVPDKLFSLSLNDTGLPDNHVFLFRWLNPIRLYLYKKNTRVLCWAYDLALLSVLFKGLLWLIPLLFFSILTIHMLIAKAAFVTNTKDCNFYFYFYFYFSSPFFINYHWLMLRIN
jgi:hypothetical protein